MNKTAIILIIIFCLCSCHEKRKVKYEKPFTIVGKAHITGEVYQYKAQDKNGEIIFFSDAQSAHTIGDTIN